MSVLDLFILENGNSKIPFLCHRIPERTFKIGKWHFPVCSRCTGIYIGAFSYFIFVMFFSVQYTLFIISLALVMIIPCFIDGFTQLNGIRKSNNQIRFFSGLIAGLGLGILMKAFKFFIFG